MERDSFWIKFEQMSIWEGLFCERKKKETRSITEVRVQLVRPNPQSVLDSETELDVLGGLEEVDNIAADPDFFRNPEHKIFIQRLYLIFSTHNH